MEAQTFLTTEERQSEAFFVYQYRPRAAVTPGRNTQSDDFPHHGFSLLSILEAESVNFSE